MLRMPIQLLIAPPPKPLTSNAPDIFFSPAYALLPCQILRLHLLVAIQPKINDYKVVHVICLLFVTVAFV